MWVEKLKEYDKNDRFISIKPPATEDEISILKAKLGEIPKELLTFLKECNGDNSVFMSVDDIIETNLTFRNIEYYMPLDCLLFFARNGCRDYYGYRITKEGITPDIFFWGHELDNRTWIADGLDHFINRYLNDEI